MTDLPVKPWWTSLTVWASVIGTLCGLATAAHVDLSWVGLSQEQAAQTAAGVATVIAALVALYGRLRATRAIGTPPPVRAGLGRPAGTVRQPSPAPSPRPSREGDPLS